MIPLIGMTQAGGGRSFTDDGMPTGGPGWEEVEFPDLSNEKVFALEVQGDSMEPLYRDGDILIVSPTRERPQGRPRRRPHHERRGHGEGDSSARPQRASSCARSTPSTPTAPSRQARSPGWRA